MEWAGNRAAGHALSNMTVSGSTRAQGQRQSTHLRSVFQFARMKSKRQAKVFFETQE